MTAFLRRWHGDDAGTLVDIYARADPDLLSNIPDDPSLAGAQAWLEGIRRAEEVGSTVAFAIVDGDSSSAPDRLNESDDRMTAPDRLLGRTVSEEAARTSKPIGNVMATAIDRKNSIAWISYWLDPEARGQGVAAAGLRSFVDHLHDECGIYRLELGYRVNNPASAAVAKAAGFLVEGRQRERLLYSGVRCDTVECARLVGDPRPQRHTLPIPEFETTAPGGRDRPRESLDWPADTVEQGVANL